jgi:hypothetical protein
MESKDLELTFDEICTLRDCVREELKSKCKVFFELLKKSDLDVYLEDAKSFSDKVDLLNKLTAIMHEFDFKRED